MNKKLFVISGSSGVGKGTVLKGFLENNPEFMLSVSCTTRLPREGEVDGINYFFLTKDEFQQCIDNEKFLNTLFAASLMLLPNILICFMFVCSFLIVLF